MPRLNQLPKQSDTRLTIEQKTWLASARELFIREGGVIGRSRSGRVTVCLKPEFFGSRMDSMTVSVASPHERKVRRKVGEYIALTRARTDSVRIPTGSNPDSLAEVFDRFGC